jgi:pimeloyl-ACP methyl ester carboxylesterase/DNA-binding SARP family transcriptional activator
MRVEIGLLGPFSVRVDGSVLSEARWARRDAVSLVKVLALSDGGRRHREQVMDLLWPGLDVADAGPRLHKAAHYARRAIGSADAVVLKGDMVSLLPEADVTVDLTAFEAAAANALRSRSPVAAGAVLDAYVGDPLPDDVYADWSAEVCDRVRAQRHQLMRQAGRWAAILDMDPLDEEAHLAIMSDLARHGDHRGALLQFELMDRTFQRQLGTGPGPEAMRLREQLTKTLRASGPIPPAEEGRMEQQIRFCKTADGVNLAYASSGEGPPLVKAAHWLTHLDHDWRSPVRRHWLVELSRRHRLIRYDERGCGLSDWDIPENTFESWVTDLEAVVEASGLDRFPMLGISQGAAVAVVYAARHPERVTRLVLYGGYAQGRLARARGEEDRRAHELQVELARLGWGTVKPALRQVFTSQFLPDGSRELWDSFNELQRQTTSAENAARVLMITGDIDVREEASQVRAPTLVLHARNDQRPPFEQGRLLAASIPDSRFVALESNNHILLGDEPAWPIFLAEVEAFLDAG